MNATTLERDAGLPEMVGDAEVCKAIGRTQQTVGRYVRSGILPRPVVIGQRRYWPRETIAAFLRGESSQPAGAA